VLRPGGELRIVANRHLGHHAAIRRVLGAVEVVGSDPRFVVLSATRR
jgi:16S rRNA (guanine1207-N2)-methyltransferase